MRVVYQTLAGLSPRAPAIMERIPKDHHYLHLSQVSVYELFERISNIQADVDTYFFCLATLQKARLKYDRILQSQAIPTFDQVGPRGLLQYGTLRPASLVALLFWRKWMYDIDNRAAQETGYVFEPIIAYAIGGVPYSAKKSPIKRIGQPHLGRQVDCIVDKRAYEFKIRVTIAASGQGRWAEETGFPDDCRESGYIPVLIVLDPTSNSKLDELRRAFVNAGGEVYIGEHAWSHLADVAGSTMARFLELYVHQPLQQLLVEVPHSLPDLRLRFNSDSIVMEVGGEYLVIQRDLTSKIVAEQEDFPDDIDENGPIP